MTVRLSMIMTARRARPMLAADKVVVPHATPPHLLPKIVGSDRDQQSSYDPSEHLTGMFIELETEPRDRQAQQTRQRHMAHSGKDCHRQRLRAAPASRPRHEHKRQPVRGNRRMEKCHRKTGDRDGRKNGRLHERKGQPARVVRRCRTRTLSKSSRAWDPFLPVERRRCP